MTQDKDVLATLPSRKQARRTLDEIAIPGGWKLLLSPDDNVVYKKGTERLGIEKKADRQYQILKWSLKEENESI
jgi:hypothetical protein